MGDEERFERLYQAHLASVHRYVLRRAPEAADDVAAETFAVAWRRLNQVPEEALPWLLGVARRLLANEHRRGRRLAALRNRLEAARPLPATVDASISDGRIARTLTSMTAAEREAITLVAWDGLSQEQAAVVVGATRAAFSMRLARARRRLEAELDPSRRLSPRCEEQQADA